MASAKTKNKKPSSKPLNFTPFSEGGLVVFAMVFAAIGTYSWLHSFALTPSDGYFVPASDVSHETAWFSSVFGAMVILTVAAPVTVFLLWFLWRRSELVLWLKLVLTVAPVLIIMAIFNG
jgi:hypothetical protein